jgi:aminoglycoside/choline kinase family phosphotransferase
MDHWDELLAWWYEGPLTLLHGDSHLGNFFVEGDEMGMIDFQAAHWGKGIRDVQYFLIDSLPVDMLAVNEHALVRFYTEQLAEQGVQLSFDTAWEQYRAYSFQTLMTIVVSLGLGPLTEGDVLMSEITRRAVAACERVDFRGWLEQTIISG